MNKPSAILLVAMAASLLNPRATCLAQLFEPGFSAPNQYYQQALIEGGDELSPDVVDIVAQSLSKRLRERAKSEGRALTGVALYGNWAEVGSGAHTCPLFIGYADVEEEPSQEQLRAMWEEGRKELEAALQRVQRAASDRKEAERQRRGDLLRRRQQNCLAELEHQLSRLEELERDSSGTPDQVQAQLAENLHQLRQLRLDQTTIAARREAIEQRIDQLRVIAAKQADDDPVIAELRKIVEIREQQFAVAKRLGEAGQQSEGEVQQAEAAVADARIELLKAQRGNRRSQRIGARRTQQRAVPAIRSGRGAESQRRRIGGVGCRAATADEQRLPQCDAERTT